MNTYKTSKSKENILRRIRTQLRQASLPQPYPEAEKKTLESVIVAPGPGAEESFAREFIALGGKFVYCQSESELGEKLKALMQSRGWPALSCPQEEWKELAQQAGISVLDYLPSPEEQEVKACLTGCEFLIARTGSIMISSAQREGRTSTIYPEVHLVVARAAQLVEDLSHAFQALKTKYPEGLPSMINLTTGPSRTADIEKTLVVGVHGPGEIFCFFVDDLSDSIA